MRRYLSYCDGRRGRYATMTFIVSAATGRSGRHKIDFEQDGRALARGTETTTGALQLHTQTHTTRAYADCLGSERGSYRFPGVVVFGGAVRVRYGRRRLYKCREHTESVRVGVQCQ